MNTLLLKYFPKLYYRRDLKRVSKELSRKKSKSNNKFKNITFKELIGLKSNYKKFPIDQNPYTLYPIKDEIQKERLPALPIQLTFHDLMKLAHEIGHMERINDRTRK